MTFYIRNVLSFYYLSKVKNSLISFNSEKWSTLGQFCYIWAIYIYIPPLWFKADNTVKSNVAKLLMEQLKNVFKLDMLDQLPVQNATLICCTFMWSAVYFAFNNKSLQFIHQQAVWSQSLYHCVRESNAITVSLI